MSIEPHHPDLFWYGIHGVEALYTMLGRGCISVTYKVEKDVEWTTGKWSGGRTGVFRGVKKGKYQPIAQIWGADGQAKSTGGFKYNGLCEAIARFFQRETCARASFTISGEVPSGSRSRTTVWLSVSSRMLIPGR